VLRAVIESPGHAARVRGAVRLRGWVLRDDGTSPDTLTLEVDRQPYGAVAVDQERSDVVRVHGLTPASSRCGFDVLVAQDRPGQLQLVLRSAETGDEPLDVRWCFIAQPRARVVVDSPGPDTRTAGLLPVRGAVELQPGEEVVAMEARAGHGAWVALDLETPAEGRAPFSGVVLGVPGDASIDVVARLTDGEPYVARVAVVVEEAPPAVDVTSVRRAGDVLIAEGVVTGGRASRPHAPSPLAASAPLGWDVVVTDGTHQAARTVADRSVPGWDDARSSQLAVVRAGFRVAAPAAAGEWHVEVAGPDGARASVPLPAPQDGPAGEPTVAVTREAPTATFLIPAHGHSELTRQCLDALRATVPGGTEWEAVVVDDASPDDTWEMLQAQAARDARVRPIRNERNLGYVGTVNAGARHAGGDLLIHLNNDSEPQPGWFEPLVEVLAQERDAGIVGGKLVHPDGLLQEAGAVVFSDGGIYNVGRDQDPADPLYGHRRDVDYCSFALAAMPRTVFEQLGGLDERYAPIYYDDVDLCFSARAAGLRVIFEPRSVVVHHESASLPGERPEAPPNRDVFVAKWGDALRTQPAHPAVLDEPTIRRLVDGARPRAILLTARWPEVAVVEDLQGEGFAVTAVALDAADEDRREALSRAGVTAYAGPLVPGAGAGHVQYLTVLVRALMPARTIVDARGLEHVPVIRTASPGTEVRELPGGLR
jgi:GT2 family glycosyltransferase